MGSSTSVILCRCRWGIGERVPTPIAMTGCVDAADAVEVFDGGCSDDQSSRRAGKTETIEIWTCFLGYNVSNCKGARTDQSDKTSVNRRCCFRVVSVSVLTGPERGEVAGRLEGHYERRRRRKGVCLMHETPDGSLLDAGD